VRLVAQQAQQDEVGILPVDDVPRVGAVAGLQGTASLANISTDPYRNPHSSYRNSHSRCMCVWGCVLTGALQGGSVGPRTGAAAAHALGQGCLEGILGELLKCAFPRASCSLGCFCAP
jgi:hypothetical protein